MIGTLIKRQADKSQDHRDEWAEMMALLMNAHFGSTERPPFNREDFGGRPMPKVIPGTKDYEERLAAHRLNMEMEERRRVGKIPKWAKPNEDRKRRRK